MIKHDIVRAVAEAQARDWAKAEAVVQVWLEREGIELSARDHKRFLTRVFVRNGADFPWRRLLQPEMRERMQEWLAWAQSKKRWSQR